MRSPPFGLSRSRSILAKKALRQLRYDLNGSTRRPAQLMPRALDHVQRSGSGYQSERGSQFVRRAEWIPRAVYERRLRPQIREVSSSELCRLVGRMQRIGEQQQSRGKLRILGRRHARLSSAIGVSAQKHATRKIVSYAAHGLAYALAVVFRPRRKWWSMRALAAEWQVKAIHRPAAARQILPHGYEQRSITIRTCAVREN